MKWQPSYTYFHLLALVTSYWLQVPPYNLSKSIITLTIST